MADTNELFPICIGFGSTQLYEYAGDIFTAASGANDATVYWSQHKRAFNVATGIKTQEDFEDFLNFWHVLQGDTFLFNDHFDNSSTTFDGTIAADDQQIGIGDNAETDFQIIKNRTFGSTTSSYNITEPVSSTLLVAEDGTPTSAYTLLTGGIIRFDTAPGSSVVVTAGYDYYIRCIFGDTQFAVRAPTKAEESFFLQGTITVLQYR